MDLNDVPELDLTDYMDKTLAEATQSFVVKDGVSTRVQTQAEKLAAAKIAETKVEATKKAVAPPDPDDEKTDPAIIVDRGAGSSRESKAKAPTASPSPPAATAPKPLERRKTADPMDARRLSPTLPPPSATPPIQPTPTKRPIPIQSLPSGRLQAVPLPASTAATPDISLDKTSVTPALAAVPSPVAAPQPRPAVRMPDLGPVETFMKDPEISEVMINDIRNVMIEKAGRLTFSGFSFQTIDEVNRITRNILDITGRILSPEQPYVDTMLPDGSRVNIIGPPLTLHGPCITIRKFPSRALGVDDLIRSESLDRRVANFLHSCVQGRINMIVSGGTGSGKTTLLNVLLSFIPKGERIVTIEDTPELVVSHTNSVRLQTKPQTPSSVAITSRELVANALRMRPDRLVVGECRRGEAFDMLQAMNTGHEGSMTTLHANSARDALVRLETLCLLAGVDLPLIAIRKQIASAVDLVIHIKRFRSGRRRVMSVSEVTGIEGETITMQEIFVYDTDSSSKGSDNGKYRCTGFVPLFLDKLRENGVELPKGYFN